MRKSFKKVLCAVMAASMVFSTPIATNVVAQAATGKDGASLTVPVTASTTLNDVVSDSKANGYQSKYSDLYGVEGNFDVTFTLTNVTSDMGGNWNAPDVDIRSAATIEDASLIAQYRPDNWLNKGAEITVNKGQWETDNATWMSNGEWNGYKGILKDAVAFVNVKKTDTTYEVTETFIGSATNTQYAGKKFEMNYVTTPASMPETTYIDFTIDACTATVSHVSYATSSNKSIKADDAVALVTNGAKTAKVNVEVKDGETVVPDASVTYESSDEKVATVDDEGTVTAVADGTAVVRSTCEGVTANTVVLVTTKADSIKISGEAVKDGKAKLEMLKSKKDNAVAPGSTTLTATVSPENAVNKDYEWTVNGTAVTVDANGVVKTADDAKDGDTATVTATVKGTEISDSVEFTIGVKEVEAFVDPTSVVVSPADVTANAGEEVKFTATVYGEGEALATNQGVAWSAENASGTDITISEEGVLTVPSDVKEGDKINVTATSKANGEVTGTATIKVHLYEPLTGTGWWGNHQTSKDRILKGDESVSFILENNKADTAGNIGFCVEAYAVKEEVKDGVTKYVKYEDASVATGEKGAYITSAFGGDPKFNGWVAGIPAAKLEASGKGADLAANSDNFYNISTSKEDFLPEHTYKVTVTKKGSDYLILVKDMDNDTWLYRQIFKGVDMESNTLGIHFMAQVGTFNLVDTDDHLTTNTTDKPQVVRPKPNPGNNTTPSPSPSPSNNNTNKNNTTNNNKTTTLTDAKSTVKAAKITVKKGKKAVSKVTVKKGKKVTLKVSVNSKGKLSVAKLSKKAKKIAKVTLKKGKLTIKGKKKGKVTLKIKAAKTSKYKKATKSIKVTVK